MRNVFRILSAVVAGLVGFQQAQVPFAFASETKNLSIDDIQIDTGKYEEMLKDIPMTIDPEMLEKAGKAIPADMNERIEKEKTRLIEKHFNETVTDVYKSLPEDQSVDVRTETVLKEDERIYIFISSSIPEDTLKNYVSAIDRLGEPYVSIVMRGFVGGMKKIKPTLEFLRGVLLKDPSCDSEKCDAWRVLVNIDPLLFRRYGIESVPAVVYARGIKPLDPTISEGLPAGAETKDYYVLYGDISLDGAFELIDREAKSKSLACLALKLRRGDGYERECR